MRYGYWALDQGHGHWTRGIVSTVTCHPEQRTMLYRSVVAGHQGPSFALYVSPWYETLEALDLATRNLGDIAHGALEALDLESEYSGKPWVNESWERSVPERLVKLRPRTLRQSSMPEHDALRRRGHSGSSVARALSALYVGQVTTVDGTTIHECLCDVHMRTTASSPQEDQLHVQYPSSPEL